MLTRSLNIAITFLWICTATLAANSNETIRVGVHYNPPLCSIDSSGLAKGIFIDIINQVAEINNWHVEYIPTTIATGFDALHYGKIDLLTTVAKTEEREQLVLFNEETIYTNWGVIYCNSNTVINNITDLGGKTIALEKGDTHARALLKLLEDFNVEVSVIWCENLDQVFQKIGNKEADAGAVNKLYGYLQNINQKLKATSIYFNPVNVHIAGGPLTSEILNKIDLTLLKLKSEQPDYYSHTINHWVTQDLKHNHKWLKPVIYGLIGLTILLLIILIFQIRTVKNKTVRLKEARKLGAQRAKTIKQLEDEKALILNSLDEQVVFIDNDYNIVWANHAFKQSTGVPFEKVIGKKCHETYFNRATPCDFCQYETCLKTNRTEVREHISQYSGNTYVHKTHPVFDSENRPIGFVEILSDVTEKKKYEEELIAAKEKAEQSDLLKSAFLANMSHEIRTPMNAIIGFSELLEDDSLTHEEKKRYLSIIQSNGDQLLKLISDILTFSQIESGHLSLQYSQINVLDFLNAALQQFESEIIKSKKAITIKLDARINKHLEIETDTVRFKQIVFNLITNAIKFTEQGSITIGAFANECQLTVFVKDTGIGIPEEKHEDIFKRFSQVDNVQLRKMPGSGLGLTIANDLIKQLGGSIHLKSKPGKGSIFYLKHPLTRYKLAKNEAISNAHPLEVSR
ncbi:ATP-binding protein [Carboxylicivirga taeanensis]|uniref:ATP-binding protein n=1 Tax=Carboxylicivirga taeanensis TaxID=1416875 RepID=UPI003F6E1560